MSCCVSTISGSPPGGGAGTTVVRQGVLIRGVDVASLTGSTDITVALFNGATTDLGSVAIASWMTRVDSATLGTTVTISQSGVYDCLFYTPLAQGVNVQAGVTYNAPVAIRQGNFEPFAASVFASNFKFSTTIQGGLQTKATIPVLQSEIDGGTSVIRAQWGNIQGNPPQGQAAIDPGNVCLRIFRVGDVAA